MEPLLIAELGLNHHGSLSKALRMIDKAKEAGADIAKFQYYDPISVLGKDHPELEYALSCQFTKREHEILKQHCDKVKIEYLVSIFDIKDVEWADGLCKQHKIASRMNTNLEFISGIEKCEKPVIMSIQKDQKISLYHQDRFYFMWCVRNYPSTMQEVLDHQFGYKYGLSSHCPDYWANIEAYKKDARIFENHVCEDVMEKGCDISSSITFEDYKKMTTEIKRLCIS